MDHQKFIIPKIPAQGILSSALQTEDGWHFSFHADDPSKEYMVEKTKQDACPIFYQALKLLDVSSNEPVCDLLSEIFVYIDFTGIFNRRATGKVLEQQQKAECMFRPEGIIIDFGKGLRRYLAFERSASMSRNNTLCFVREDMYEPLRERIMLGMKIGNCQLSKLYAYNALMLTSGERRDIPDLLSEKRIIVIDNPKSIVKDAHIITVEDNGTANTMRKYTRVETTADIEVLEFDGEGLISKELAFVLDSNEQHHSFQIRLPYIKGVVHEVDFKTLFAELNVPYIRDIWENQHDPNDVDMILTKSMFKGFGWMTENGLTWAEYLERCRRYDHALYISGWDKLGKQITTELNYQFLNTLAMTEDEFRPRDLPLGWDRSPNTDPRHWVTKTTEAAYYNLIADENSRQAYFSAIANDEELPLNDKKRQRAKLAQKNPLFLKEKIYTKELYDQAEAIQKNYGLGKLLVTGDNRYLSDDLMRLLAHLVKAAIGEGYAYRLLEKELLSGNEIYAPEQSFPQQEQYTLLRSPHIARNEEALVVQLNNVGEIRKKYLSHLHYVLMVDSRSMIPERLGGADYDGDMIKTIADPLINTCVLRGYKNGEVLPVLKIPAAEPLIADAGDWNARFETVKVTFSNRVGLISNTALRSGIIAYNESADSAEREQSRKETETLAILTGLEIDSAKSGIRPDLSEFLVSNRGRKSLFLRYKSIFGDDDSEKKWYEDSQRTKIKKFIASVNWDTVTANLELLPYYAYMLEKETKKHIPKPAPDSELFSFTKDPRWKATIDPDLISRIQSLIQDYETAKGRCRYLKHLPKDFKRRSDIDRILFSRGQENIYTSDELYTLFGGVSSEQIRRARFQLSEQNWPLTPPEDRRTVIYAILPCHYDADLLDLFCDFRCGGYRLLGDVICDLDDLYRKEGIKKSVIRKGDSADLKRLLRGVMESTDAEETIRRNCMTILHPLDRRETKIDFCDALKCAVALGERQFALEVLPGVMLEYAITNQNEPKRKKRWFRA